MIRNELGKGAIYIYIQLVSSMVSGYIFFILLAKVTSTEIIGTFALLVSISEIFANIAIFGLHDSIQKFAGKSFLQNKITDAKIFVKVAFILLSAGIIVSCAVILLIRNWLFDLFGIGFGLIIVLDMLIASYAIYTLSYSVVVASLKTKVLPIIITVSSVAKICLSLSLVLLGSGITGLALGYTFFGHILSSIFLWVVIRRIFKKSDKLASSQITHRYASKNLFAAGVVAWIPGLITTLGIDLGTLVLYGVHGPYESGIYFVTFAILNAINAITYAIFAISLPVLSSMKDGRKRFAWQTIRIICIIVLPLSSSIIFYSNDIIQLIGTNYTEGSLSLQILLLSTFPTIILSGVDTLLFSYGQYRHSLAVNLASSLPRTILYFTLVPIFGMMGLAMSYTIGAGIGFIVATVIAKRITMLISWKRLVLTLFLPLCLSFIFSILNVNYLVGIAATICISYLLLMKLHIIEKSDGSFFIEIMPDQISKPLLSISRKLERIIDWFYG